LGVTKIEDFWKTVILHSVELNCSTHHPATHKSKQSYS
jgi:hypothetical protein